MNSLFDPNQLIRHGMQTKHIKALWGDLKGPINIIYEAWDSTRWTNQMKNTIQNDSDKPVIDILKKIEYNNGYDTLANWLVSIGPLVTTGDLFALQYILLILTNLYDSTKIRLHDAWRMDRECCDKEKNEIIDLDGSIILIGGPSGNPITKRLLTKMEILNTLFPHAPVDDLEITQWGTNNVMSPIINMKNGINDTDCGLFLYGQNPWNESTNFFAAMGSLSWGTQAAAALSCSDQGAKLIMEGKNKIKKYHLSDNWVKGIGYVEVKSQDKKGLPMLVVPNCDFQMVWPIMGPKQKNPEVILRSADILKRAMLPIFERKEIQDINNSLAKFKPLRQIVVGSFVFFGISLFSFLTWLFFNLIIIRPFWSIVGLYLSGSFLVLSWALNHDWKKEIVK